MTLDQAVDQILATPFNKLHQVRLVRDCWETDEPYTLTWCDSTDGHADETGELKLACAYGTDAPAWNLTDLKATDWSVKMFEDVDIGLEYDRSLPRSKS